MSHVDKYGKDYILVQKIYAQKQFFEIHRITFHLSSKL